MNKEEMRKYYKIRSGDLIFRRYNRAKPIFMYLFLSMMSYVPKRYIHFVSRIIDPLKLKSTFYVLNRKMNFYISSNLYDFKYHGGLMHELRISENLLRLCPNNAVFYDLGSATGWYSILLSKKCKKIYGFDPEDQSSLKNIRLNQINNFEFYPYFISNRQEGGVKSLLLIV